MSRSPKPICATLFLISHLAYKRIILQCIDRKKELYYLFHSLQEVQQLTTVPELELFLLEHGEEVIDMLGQQVDRIEKNIKVKKRYHLQWNLNYGMPPVNLAKPSYNLCIYYLG